MISNKNQTPEGQIEEMFSVGAHFAYDRSRRHPSTKSYIFGVKNNTEIYDLEKTQVKLKEALEFIKKTASEGKSILFVGGKKEALKAIQDGAEKVNMPYVAGRWIGGVLTNFEEIRKRVTRYLDLASQKMKGELVKYKKKERLLIEREIEDLEARFGGISDMSQKPGALFVIDPEREYIARDEAIQTSIPVVGLASSDNDYTKIKHVIPANDSSIKSIKYFVEQVVKAIQEGVSEAKLGTKTEEKTPFKK